MNTSSHSLDHLDVSFDAQGLVANAGLLLPMSLAQRLGLPELLRRHIHLGSALGANPDRKAMTMLATLLAGGEWIDDCNQLRAGGAGAQVLGLRPAAPSTVGSFLRAFSMGHVRQLDAVQEDLLQRAWDLGGGALEETVKLDLDSSLIETYGLHKQGARHYTYQQRRGYHPLLAVVAESGEVIHARLREGKAAAGRGASNFARQALARLRRAGATSQVVLRADSGFYAEKVVEACRAHHARFSITVRLGKGLQELIAALPEQAWQPIPYWLEGAADVAETSYSPFGKQHIYRLIVRRVRPTPKTQLWLQGVGYSYHAFLTDRQGEMLELEADHRQHAVIENVIRELKYGCGLNHLPSGKFGANAAWLALNVIAHNLCRWLGRFGGFASTCLKTWRARFFSLPGRLVAHGRQRRLRLPVRWPWRHQFVALLTSLRALPTPLLV